VALDLNAPAPRWDRLPAPQLLDDPTTVRIVGAVAGERVVLTGIGPSRPATTAVFDGIRWRDAPPPPVELSRQAEALWTGRGVLVWNRFTASGAHLDPASLSWERVPPAPVTPGPPRPAAWTGQDLVIWGGFDAAGALLSDAWPR
jgi:hypothetical protein